MGLVDSALQIGRSALLSYQSALQVVGTNISNAGNADYTRQSPGLTAMNGPGLAGGMRPGAGVALTSIKRHLDEALENRIRSASGQRQSLDAQRRANAMVETLFDPLTGLQISQKLTNFFNSLSEVQSTPTDNAIRDLAVSSAVSLADTLRQTRDRLAALGDDLNGEISAMVAQANRITGQVAELNTEITAAEATGAPASALRDQRDAMLRDLSELIEISVRNDPEGSVNVYAGNETLVQGGVSRGLAVITRFDGDSRRDNVAFADTNAQVTLTGGQLEGLIKARDGDALGRIADIDQLAGAIIAEVNRIHADGQGLVGLTSAVSSYSVADTSAALNDAEIGLPAPPSNGSFYIAVSDGSLGGTSSYQIQIDLDGIGDETSLESLVADINSTVTGVTASITVDNRLSLSADSGLSFTFGYDGQSQREDSSGVLASLGVNTLFEGTSADDIAVREEIVNQAGLLAAGSVNLAGDGTNAGRMALVGDVQSDLLAGSSISEFYMRVANDVAVSSANARDGVEASASVLSSLQAQKENISGVSLDEEAIELVKYERAFQGAARFVNVVNRLMSELIDIVR